MILIDSYRQKIVEAKRIRRKRKVRQRLKQKSVSEVVHQIKAPRSFRRRFLKKERNFFRKNKKTYCSEYESEVRAPEVFSLIKNPEGVIDFINKLNSNLKKGKSTFVHLTKIRVIEHNAIVLLLAVMNLFKNKGIDFEGNKPFLDRECLNKIQSSGFFHYLFKGQDFHLNNLRIILLENQERILVEIKRKKLSILQQNEYGGQKSFQKECIRY